MWKSFLLFIWLCLMGRSMILITSMIWIISMIPLPFIDINSMEENFVPDIKSLFSYRGIIIRPSNYRSDSHMPMCITFSYHSFGHLSIYTTDYSSLFLSLFLTCLFRVDGSPEKGFWGGCCCCCYQEMERVIYFFSVFLGRRTAWMLGRTPP